jgi:MFS family permease
MAYGTIMNSNHNSEETVISIDDAIQSIGMGPFQRRVLWAAGLCFTADATEVMLLSFLSLTLQSEWGLSNMQTATMTSAVFGGSLIGTLFFGYFGDHYGRRPAFLLACAIISLFGLATSFATGFPSLVGVRFMVGFGVGGLVVPFDIFAEFLPTSHRGVKLLHIEYFWTAGSLITPLFAYLTLETSWRIFVVLCAVPCLISGILGLWLVPESPRWLISMGRHDEAKGVLRSAAIANKIDPDSLFHANVTLKNEKAESSNFLDLLSNKWRRISLFLWGTWVGYAIGYYGVILAVSRIFDEDAMNDEQNEEGGGVPHFNYQAIFISASAEILALIVVIHTVDSLGRIPTQVMSYLFGGVCVFTLAMLAAVTSNSAALTTLAFLARALEMMGSCVTWVTTAEILTTEIRTTGHSAANAMGRTGAFLSPYLVGTMSLQAVGSIMLLIHLFTAFCAWNLPETKGREIGHTSLDDDNGEEGKDDGNEMSFRYDSDGNMKQSSSRRIV